MTTQEINSPMRRVRFAVLGDMEPKPEPVFVNLKKAVEAMGDISEKFPIDFVATVGDIAHKGTLAQYEAATTLFNQVKFPIFGIMGNEEMAGGKERYQEYAKKWNSETNTTPELRFVKIFGRYAYIFATASINGVEFSAEDIDWLEQQIQLNSHKAVTLFTHAPARGMYAIEERLTIPNEQFKKILRSPNLHLHFSGHTHIDPDFVETHVRDQCGTHHVHAPGIERTKIGNSHTPRFRVVTMEPDGSVDVQLYNLDEKCFEEKHRVQFAVL